MQRGEKKRDLEPESLILRWKGMPCRILYFRGGILEEIEDFAPEDLFEAARLASSTHPHLTAEIWQDGRKAAVIRPCSRHRTSHSPPPQIRRLLVEKELQESLGIKDGKDVSQESSDEMPTVLPKPSSRY
jgi:hypothetical protein